MSIEIASLFIGALLIVAVLSSKVADRVGVPSLLVFLLVGMLAGSEGLGGIEFDNPEAAQSIGSLALLIILFAGGLDTDWGSVKRVLGPGIVMSTVGVVLPMLLLGTFAWFVLGTFSSFRLGFDGLTWIQALLVASIVSSTDAAAVFSVYRTSPVQPKKKLRSLLEFESGSNDPMAVLLTMSILGIMTGGNSSPTGVIGTLLAQFACGGIVGAGIGWAGVKLVNQLHLSATGLYQIVVLGLGFLAFGLSDLLYGNGFLAVYIAGLIIGNGIHRHRSEILSFHDGLSWMMQIIMFIMLGLLVFPSKLVPVAGVSIALALFLMFVARPISTVICYLPFRPTRNELAYVSWVGLRGSVPIVLATFPATYGIDGADQIFHVIFFIVLASVLIQGLTLVPAAKWLRVTQNDEEDTV
jgi:cell volume regulation protein A